MANKAVFGRERGKGGAFHGVRVQVWARCAVL